MSKKKSRKKRQIAQLAAKNHQHSGYRKKQKRQAARPAEKTPLEASSPTQPKAQPEASLSSLASPQVSPDTEQQPHLPETDQRSEIGSTGQKSAILDEKSSQNDQWSEPVQLAQQSETEAPAQPEIDTELEKTETEHQSAQLAAQPAPLQDQKLSNDSRRKRHKLFPLIWWILGIVMVIALAIGGYWLIQRSQSVAEVSQDQPDPGTSSSEGTDNAEGSTNPDQSESTDPVEEPNPEDAPEPADPPKEVPPETQPSTGNHEGLDPISPRPPHDDLPEVTPGSHLIALTFDDGPSPVNTPRLLDILSGRHAKATFFVLGNLAERNPSILQRQAAEGHEVASHTPYHDQLTLLTAEQARWQALEMDRIFTNTLGTVPPFTRPPYGAVNATVQTALGQPLIMWSVDPRDWQDRNSNIVCDRVVSAAFDGAIVLMHDIHATTVDAVPCIIDNLRARGYEFLTVSDLAAARDIPLINGQIYYSF